MGSQQPDGHEYTSANGYRYRKVEGRYKLVHHIIAEEALGRSIDTSLERVIFKDGKRDNFDPNNIVVMEKKNGRQQKIDKLKADIARKQAELDELEAR